MILILDADALIKLNHIGALALVAANSECIIPDAVYQEAVVNARAAGHLDSDAIDQVVREQIQVAPIGDLGRDDIPDHFGAGEKQVLALALGQPQNSVVVSDDQVFVNLVRQLEVRFMSPIELFPVLSMERVISVCFAREFVERFRPHTAERNYLAALTSLEEMDQDHAAT